MYRIMIVKAKKDDYKSLYQYLTTTIDGATCPIEFETKEELDTYVESMLNSDYAKSDFIVIKHIDYTIDAKDYSDDEAAQNDSED